MDVLINHPAFGSFWLSNCEIIDNVVVGEVWNNSNVGSPYFPDDYRGQSEIMNFPLSCIRKKLV